jgi:hypothetical protein
VKQLRAIVIQTMRSAIRSRVFHILFLFIALAVVALPIMVSGDGTAKGQAQITLTYSLGVVVALISTTTLWLACSQLPKEIEDYTIHMVTTKPCPRWVVWVGKWLGVVIMNSVILFISASIIYGLVHIDLVRRHFSEGEMERLKAEVLVGRRAFVPTTPDFVAMARQEYEKQKAAGELNPKHDPEETLKNMVRDLKAKSTSIDGGGRKTWRFENVRVPEDTKNLFLRYRHYAGSTSQSSQRDLRGVWIVEDPHAKGNNRELSMQQQVRTGTFHELAIPPNIISDDGTVVVSYLNPIEAPTEATGEDRNTSVIFQTNDGPVLLARVSGFGTNYARAMVLAFLQIAFLAALGCTVGAAFSTPVAAFVAIAYLVIGLSVQAAVNAPLQNEMGEYEYKGVLDRGAHYLARGVSTVVVSVNDFDATSDLARGRLVEYKRMLDATLRLIVIRGGLITILGIWVLSRRELGTVIRR